MMAKCSTANYAWCHSCTLDVWQPRHRAQTRLHIPRHSRQCAIFESLVRPNNGLEPESSSTVECATLVKRCVESREVLEFANSVVVMGDCRRGSHISSKGDVIVLGRCATILLFSPRQHPHRVPDG
jgi:septum formation inhibitor MinC